MPAGRDAVAGLVDEARAYLLRGGIEEELRSELAAIGRPIVELPALPEGISRDGLYTLAGLLLAGPPTATARSGTGRAPAAKANGAGRATDKRGPRGPADNAGADTSDSGPAGVAGAD